VLLIQALTKKLFKDKQVDLSWCSRWHLPPIASVAAILTTRCINVKDFLLAIKNPVQWTGLNRAYLNVSGKEPEGGVKVFTKAWNATLQ
jgi:hypothetical protein